MIDDFNLKILKASLSGELFYDDKIRYMYAQDASLYRELPLAVAYPRGEEDIYQLIQFARKHKVGLIPRAAGTSLAGQCVGSGIVVDISQYMNKILSVDVPKHTVTVQPGVVRDELNRYLKPMSLFFGPNTSTANRATIGGMVGNNSSGSYSIAYGVTRDYVIEIKGYLGDGTKVHFRPLSDADFMQKMEGNTLESQIYQQIYYALSLPETQKEIIEHFPSPEIKRRSTGYALDALLAMQPFQEGGEAFNFSKLVAGSEGTLIFITEITLGLLPLPPVYEIMVAIHFQTVDAALRSVTTTLQYHPRSVELMDKAVLDCTKWNIEQNKNRFFIEGDPAAILMVEFCGSSKEEVVNQCDKMVAEMKKMGFGYHFPFLFPPENHKAMELRKSGLGVLANMPGDLKPIEFIEDTAVRPQDLADYIQEFDKLMVSIYDQYPIYYAHAGAGELHIRPLINLKTPEGLEEFRQIATESAMIVKKYKGSLSGEHGDGRVRSEFLPFMLGEKNYQLMKRIKRLWDPDFIFNPEKIIDALPIEHKLKAPKLSEVEVPTLIDFSPESGFYKAASRCSGAGDCRKQAPAGGTMCPSYMASLEEKDSTRARARVLAGFLDFSSSPNSLNHQAIYEVMEWCISCKGCKSECPSNVDMALLKAEFLHQYYEARGLPFTVKTFAKIAEWNKMGMKFSSLTNFMLKNFFTSSIIKKILSIAPKRNLPLLSSISLNEWYESHYQGIINKNKLPIKTIYFFADEFTNYNDAETGIKAIRLLTKLGYRVVIPPHKESGRAAISKGLLTWAAEHANHNFEVLSPLLSENTPLIGIEPSAILTFRDEFARLVKPEYRQKANQMAKFVFTFEEFITSEIAANHIASSSFKTTSDSVLIHNHCHAKALSEQRFTTQMLSLVSGLKLNTIPSGCCGMAGSFGYEKDHYSTSIKIGELILFPEIRKAAPKTIIAAHGFSCRHQIFDGTGRVVLHPVEILWKYVK